MKKFNADHWLDENDNPSGGCTYGIGYTISWQNGPLGTGENRLEPNGAFVEDIMVAVIDRLEFYQKTKFACAQNDTTLKHLAAALESQRSRTADRVKRKVEGTYND